MKKAPTPDGEKPGKLLNEAQIREALDRTVTLHRHGELGKQLFASINKLQGRAYDDLIQVFESRTSEREDRGTGQSF